MAGPTSLKLTEELKERVAAVAQGVAQTPHAYMVEAIAEKVARDEKRQQFLADSQRSLEEFKRTGIAYRFEDVVPYFRARAQGKKVSRPKPIKVPKSER